MRCRRLLLIACVAACKHDADPAVEAKATDAVGDAGAASESSTPALPTPVNSDVEFLAAGDIADCDPDTGPTIDEAKKTASLLAAHPAATIAAVGDLSYPNFNEVPTCYRDAWGAEALRTYPALGNHEHIGTNERVRATKAYFDYWESAAPGHAGDRGEGWYSYDRGSWHIVALNSDCQEAVPWIKNPIDCSRSGPQMAWLKADLAAQPAGKCTLAYFHHPVWSTTRPVGTPITDSPKLQDDAVSFLPFWQELYAQGVDVILAGHLHYYMRTKPLDAAGLVDEAHGMRFFVVGTGGSDFFNDKPAQRAGFVETVGLSFGVLRMLLRPHGYSWEFLPVAGAVDKGADGGTYSDTGSAECHDPP